MERRSYATFKVQWPEKNVTICVTSPRLLFDEYLNDINTEEETISIMVGDTQRIIEYPKIGFQIPMPVPTSVIQSMQYLISIGYDKRIIR